MAARIANRASADASDGEALVLALLWPCRASLWRRAATVIATIHRYYTGVR